MIADVTVSAGDVTVANEWSTGDLVASKETGGYTLPVTPLVLRTPDVRVALRGSYEEHREVVRRMAAVVGLVVSEPNPTTDHQE